MPNETAAKSAKPPDSRPRVTALTTGDGGVTLRGIWNSVTMISPDAPWVRSSGLEMYLDRGLGGVVCHYPGLDNLTKEKRPFTTLIPMGHIRSMELAE